MKKSNIILGSSSKIRRMIMEKSNYTFNIYSPDIDETLYEHLKPIDKVKRIAIEKNKKISEIKKYHNSIIITADTLCLLSTGRTLAKPKDFNESIEMALQQSGKTISAITGVCISFRENNKRNFITKSSSTKVSYLKFSKDEVIHLMKKSKSKDKASGLGIWNDAPGFTLIKKLNGSYTGSLGLPMEIIRETLEKIYGE